MRLRFRHVLAAMLLPVALVAAGCSDDENTADESGGGATTESTQDSQASEAPQAADAAASDPRAVLPMGSPPGEGVDTSELNITQIAAGTAAVTTLTQLVVKSGLLAALRDGKDLTVFAPTNDAFAEIPFETYTAVVEDNPKLTEVLTLHVVPGVYTAADLMDLDGQTLTTLQGGKLLVEMDGDDIIVGGSKVIAPDIMASNGVIHAVDKVITAPNG